MDQSCHEPVHCLGVDLSGVSSGALMKMAGGVACEETREMTTIQIPSTAARSMTFPMSRMTSTLPETSCEANLERSSRRISPPFEDRKCRATERCCSAMNRSSARVLSPIHVKEHCSRLEHLAFIVKLLHCVWYFTVAQLCAG